MAHIRPSGATLALRHSGLTSLESCEVPEGVVEIDLRDNALASIRELQSQPALQRLFLGRNVLHDLGPLSHFPSLRALDLSDNKLSKLALSGLSALQVLNLAGNRVSSPGDLEGLSGCSSLVVIDLARNDISCCDAFLDILSKLPVKGVSFLGNPGTPGSAATPPGMAVFNARILPGKDREAGDLRALIPSRCGIAWPIITPRVNSGPVASSSSGGLETAGGPSRDAPSNLEALSGPDPRRLAVHVMDSADDMSGGGSSGGSISGAAPPLPGLVQRQDSANYQPRPPALAERQDSAQNLQALAQAEADLIRAGSPIEMAAPLARQDSANELDEARTSSPIRRHGHISGEGGEIDAATAVSPRHDSASERARLVRPQIGQPSSQPRSIVTTAGEERVLSGAPSMDRALGSASSLEGASSSLEAARLLHAASRDESPPPRAGPSTFPSTPLSPAERQDSALDSLAEARRAVLADLPQSGLSSIPSDPLRQARQLHSNLSLTSPVGAGKSRLESSKSGSRGGSPRGTVLRVEDAWAGAQGSPFDMPVNPLSPSWTLSQLPSGHQQDLPRIFSGVPWQASSSNVDQLYGVDSGVREALHNSFTGSAGPSQPDFEGSRLPPTAEEAQGSEEPGRFILPGRNGEVLRDTPYPDSPLAAGAEGARDNPAFFQQQASVRHQPDGAESSKEAAARGT